MPTTNTVAIQVRGFSRKKFAAITAQAKRLDSDSGRVFEICEQRGVLPLLSRAALDEYRATIADTELQQRYPQLSRLEIDTALKRLLYVGERLPRIEVLGPREFLKRLE
jgi:hypothetical protein